MLQVINVTLLVFIVSGFASHFPCQTYYLTPYFTLGLVTYMQCIILNVIPKKGRLYSFDHKSSISAS